MLIPATVSSSSYSFLRFRVDCSDSKQSRGFGAKSNPSSNKTKKVSSSKEEKGTALKQKSSSSPTQAPGLSSRFDGKSKTIDIDFEERLQAVRRCISYHSEFMEGLHLNKKRQMKSKHTDQLIMMPRLNLTRRQLDLVLRLESE